MQEYFEVNWVGSYILPFFIDFFKKYVILVLYGGGTMQYKWSSKGVNFNRDIFAFFCCL